MAQRDETAITCAPPFIPNIQISGDGGRVLLTIRPNGTVEGEIENASEAARRFVEHIRDMLAPPTQSDALKAAGDAIRGLLDIASDDNLDSAQAGRAYAALHDIDTALKKQSK